MRPLSARRRAVVVGGGVVGCATAYRLARAGLEVTLVERDAIATHASGHNAGNLNPLHGMPPALLPRTLDAFRLHAETRAELAELGCAEYDAQPVTRIFVGRNAEEHRELEETATLFNATAGFSAEWLDAGELHEKEPRLADDLEFGVVTEGAFTVDSHAFTRSIAQAAERLGATIVRAAARGIVAAGNRITGVQASDHLIGCDDVVFATGPWVGDMQTWLGVNVAVKPVKGELLVVRLPSGSLRYDFTLGQACLYRRRGDELWVGVTRSDCGFDCAPTAEGKEMLLSAAARLLPEIRTATLLDHMAALRPVAASNAPIAERAEGWQNVYIANGGGSKGVLLSVGIAQTLCDLILEV